MRLGRLDQRTQLRRLLAAAHLYTPAREALGARRSSARFDRLQYRMDLRVRLCYDIGQQSTKRV